MTDDTQAPAKVRYSSRKFLTMVAVCVGATALLWFDQIGESTWQQVLAFTVIPYFLANASPSVAAAWSRK